MSSLQEEFAEFDKAVELEGKVDSRSNKIDYDKYIKALNIYAAERLELPPDMYVNLKPVTLHGYKIHSLIFNVFKNGRRYSARLARRVSLGLRERETDRWYHMISKAYEIAMELPPVGLDPKLEATPYWFGSNDNYLRMEFRLNESYVLLNAIKVRKAYGSIEELSVILKDLEERGL